MHEHQRITEPARPTAVPAIITEPGGMDKIARRMLFCVGWPKTVAFSV